METDTVAGAVDEQSVFEHFFEHAAFGVVMMDLDGTLGYANSWMHEFAGRHLSPGENFSELLTPDSLEVLKAQMARRREGESGEYQLTLRTSARPRVVQILGTPVRDSHDNVVATVALVMTPPADALRESILKIDTERRPAHSVFDELRRALAQSFCFDAFIVTRYGGSVRYSKTLYAHFCDALGGIKRWNKHWAKLTTAQRDWVLRSTGRDRAIADLDRFLSQPQWRSLYDDPMAKMLRESGIRSVATVLVRQGSEIVAGLSLLTRNEAAYNDYAVKELEELPVDRVVLAVVTRLREQEAAFRPELIRKLLRAHTVLELVRTVVKDIGRQYKLRRVALFSIDHVRNQADLQAEWICGVAHSEFTPVSLSITSGIVWQAVSSTDQIYLESIAGLQADPGLHGCESGSAFCWPLIYWSGGKKLVRWVLLAVDEMQDAFAPEERSELVAASKDIECLLQRLTEVRFMRLTFDATSEAVLVIDDVGQIRRANVAAAQLFAVDNPRELSGPVEALFVRESDAVALMRYEDASRELELRDACGGRFPAMVSSRSVPAPIGGKVFAIKDLRNIRRLEELSFLGRVASEIAAQIQTPLTLATSWIRQLAASVGTARNTPGGDLAAPTDASTWAESAKYSERWVDLASRAVAQLRRAQGVVDRISVYDSEGEFAPRRAIPLSLNDEVQKVVAALPRSERERVTLSQDSGTLLISAHPEHLSFVMDTLLASFLRELPNEDALMLQTTRVDGAAVLACRVPDHESDERGDTIPAEPMTFELVERSLGKILEGYGGSAHFDRAAGSGRLLRAKIQLPLYG